MQAWKACSTLACHLREKLTGKVPEAQVGMRIKPVSSPWFWDLLEYDPAATLSKTAHRSPKAYKFTQSCLS